MEELIIGIVCSALTEGAKKFGRSPKAVILGLSVLCAIIYYVIEAVNPELITWSWHHIVAVYGVSQVVYNYGIKIFGRGSTPEPEAQAVSNFGNSDTYLDIGVPEVSQPSVPVVQAKAYTADEIFKNQEFTKRILVKKRLKPSVELGATTNLPPTTETE